MKDITNRQLANYNKYLNGLVLAAILEVGALIILSQAIFITKVTQIIPIIILVALLEIGGGIFCYETIKLFKNKK